MRLTSIFLYPDRGDFRTNAALLFRNQTRFICHFVQQYAAARKVEVHGFKRICIVCKSVASELNFRNSSNVLVVEVPFEIAEYEKTAEEDLPEYFIRLLEAGLIKACRDEPLPIGLFKDAIESFRALDYKNKWVHSTKLFRSVGLKCRLLCELDLSWFHLVLEVERKDKVIFSQEILRTLPDEVMYAHRFKHIRLDGQILRVEEKFGKPLFELDIA
jgi:hypothetical protein